MIISSLLFFLAHLSWSSSVLFWSSIVRLSIRPPFCKLSTFLSSSQEANFNQILWWKKFKFVQMKGHGFLKGEIQIEKKTLTKFQNIFSQKALGQLQLNLSKRILGWRGFSANEVSRPFPRKYNYKIAKIINEISKHSFSEPHCQLQTNFAQNIHGWREFSFLFNKGPRSIPRGDNYEILKNIDKIKWCSSPEYMGLFQPHVAQSILGRREFKFV